MSPKDDSPIMQEEIFGPILPIKVYTNMDDVVEFINDNPKPLAVYYFGSAKHADSNRLRDETSSGSYVTNECIV